MSDSPEKLWPAIRQFRKQLKDEFICGYDIELANAAYMELEGDIELLNDKVKEQREFLTKAVNALDHGTSEEITKLDLEMTRYLVKG